MENPTYSVIQTRLYHGSVRLRIGIVSHLLRKPPILNLKNIPPNDTGDDTSQTDRRIGERTDMTST
jgi:hypothetical protein